jgi:MerR family transcriptional regulator, light-induced transcriptional regulator
VREHIERGRATYRQALASGDARTALATIDGLIDAGVEFDELCEEILAPALYEIGELWETGRINVADEHLAAAISETVVASIGAIAAAPFDSRPRILVCATDGEGHAIGARMVAEAFAAADWSVRYLGASTPPDAVAAAVAAHDVDVLALSTTMSANLGAAAETIALARQAVPGLRVVVGGQAYAGDGARARAIGADVFQDRLRGVTKAVEDLVG